MKGMNIKMNKQVDARGMDCPFPVINTKKPWKKQGQRQLLQL